MLGLGGGDEELRSVGVGAGVGHGEDAARLVLQSVLDLVVEGAAVDALAALSLACKRAGNVSQVSKG